MPDEDSSLLNRAEGFWRDFGKLRQRVGTLLAILVMVAVASGGVWWFWDDIAKKPGVAEIVAWIERKPILPAKPGHLTVAVAHLEDDKNQEHEKLLHDALDNDFDGAESKAIDRTIILPDADTGQGSVAKAKEEANRLRKRAGADVLLWGRVITLKNKSEMRLYWTTGRELAGVKQSGVYTDSAETIALPPLFWDDLRQVLGMLVEARIAEITRELIGNYSADQLAPLIAQVRKLLQSRQGAWSAKTDAEVRVAFADALSDYGDQAGNNEALQESIDAYRQVLGELTRDRVPLEWATTQNNLGNALFRLGERESGTGHLTEAVAAYRAALEERTRDRVPLDWAMTQNNLGNALWRLGERESGTARLEEAVFAFRVALAERTRDRVPLDWAGTQNNLGNALWMLGERESGTARLEEAVAAFRAALVEYTRDRVPLDWATTQNNLGNAVFRLGERESGTGHLTEAVAAYRATLEERTRDRVPLDWAQTQSNLGNALARLGEQESGTAHLTEAVLAYRVALGELTRDRVPLDWATTQSNLGNALERLGERESGTGYLTEAVAAYRAALEERTRDRVPLDWATTQNNLGLALWRLGERESATAHLTEAVAAWEACLTVTASTWPQAWVQAVHSDIDQARAEIARRTAK